MSETAGETDLELLARYTHDKAEDAFTELVRRHLALVHSAALRQVRSPQLAEEVAQSAFTDLACNAHRLAPDTIVAAWLYQVTRRTAIDVVRRESRRQLREQIATELNTMNANAAEWTQIEPLLDEAMATLEDSDRAAVLLRYFENKSLREVGATLGTSDDAAQKRVSRAVERLREFFTKRGVTVGASGLVVIISANAVQAAPIGLAATISACAAAVGMTSIPVSTTGILKAMTITKAHVAALAIITALVIPLVMLYRQNASLRQELAGLRNSTNGHQSPPSVTATNDVIITAEEQRRRRMEHLELLSLRGRATQLANELKQKTGAISADPRSDRTTEPQDADSILFSASLTNRVGSEQTLAVGGWSVRGMRRYLLITPAIPNDGAAVENRKFTLQAQIVTAPEDFWAQIGWEAAKSDTHLSALSSVLSSVEVTTLLAALKDTKGSEISSGAPVERTNGQFVGFGFSTEDDAESGALMGVDIHPWLVENGKFVDLEIRPSPVTAKTQVHPSLK